MKETVFGGALMLAFLALAPALAQQEMIAQAGNAKYAANCVACHGPDLKGVQGLGMDLTTSSFVAEKSVPELVAFLKVGRMPDDPANRTGQAMPGMGWLPEEDLREIATFIKNQ